MSSEINIRELAAMMRARRGKRGLRLVAEEIGGVSASTLSRVEQGKLPDLATYLRICRWLGVAPERFTDMNTSSGMDLSPADASTARIIAAHLRADRTLDPKTAEALITMIQLAYSAIENGEITEGEEE